MAAGALCGSLRFSSEQRPRSRTVITRPSFQPMRSFLTSFLGELSENGLGFLLSPVAGDPEGGGAAPRWAEGHNWSPYGAVSPAARVLEAALLGVTAKP